MGVKQAFTPAPPSAINFIYYIVQYQLLLQRYQYPPTPLVLPFPGGTGIRQTKLER